MKTPADIQTQIATLREQLDAFERQVAADTAPRPTARGTDDVHDAAREAARATLPERIEAALRRKIFALDELCAEVRAPAGPVSAILRRLKNARKVYNVGAEDRPRWFWIVGDDCTPAELEHAVKTLIADRPFDFAELLAATGARRGRVSGQIVQMQRTHQPIKNLGDERHARWFLLPRRR